MNDVSSAKGSGMRLRDTNFKNLGTTNARSLIGPSLLYDRDNGRDLTVDRAEAKKDLRVKVKHGGRNTSR